MKGLLLRTRRRPVLLLLPLLLALSTVFIIQNELFRSFIRGQLYVYQEAFPEAEIAVSKMELFLIQLPGGRSDHGPVRTLKVSVPFDQHDRGCEFLYGLAQYHFTDEVRRFRFPFLYDYKNRRCEAKSLFLIEKDLPEEVVIRTVETSRQGDFLAEAPSSWEIALSFPDKRGSNPNTSRREAKDTAVQKTRLHPSFSLSAPPGAVSVLHAPVHDLNQFLSDRIDQYTVSCRDAGCKPITVVSALPLFPKAAEALDRAAANGVPVNFLANYQPTHRYREKRYEHIQPLEWLRFQPFSEEAIGVKLPMHAKFIVLGGETVFSGAINEFINLPSSRQDLFIYEHEGAAARFQEIAARIRSMYLAPVQLESDKRLHILLNASLSKASLGFHPDVFLRYHTKEGTASSAYGFVLDRLSEIPGRFLVSMSPMSQGCASLKRRICWYQILREKALQDDLRLIANLRFLIPEAQKENYSPSPIQELNPDDFHPRFQTLIREVNPGPEDLLIRSFDDRAQSTDHQRVIVAGRRAVVAGSANFAYPETLNTIELIEDSTLNLHFRRYQQTLEEPYLIIPAERAKNNGVTVKGCHFVREWSVFGKPASTLRRIPRRELEKLLFEQHGIAADEELTVIEPTEPFEPFHSKSFRERPLPEMLHSHSSYFCLSSRNDERSWVIFRLPELSSRDSLN